MRDAPLFPPLRRRKPGKRKLRPATKGCAQCENLLAHRHGPPTQCGHRGRRYRVNGLLTVNCCVCCARKALKRGATLRLLTDKKN